MLSYRTIVVGTDFSPLCDLGVAAAVGLANRSAAERLHIVHVVAVSAGYLGTGYVAPFPAAGSALDPIFERAMADARMRLDELPLPATSVRITREVSLGIPVRELARSSAEAKADLIVVSSHRRRGIARVVLGSVADALIRVAHCPILVVGEGRPAATPFKKVLAAVDLSPASERVVRNAIAMAQASQGTVHALSLLELPTLQPGIGEALPIYLTPEESGRLLDEHKERVRVLADRIKHPGVTVEIDVDVRHARPIDAVLEVATEVAADLVVVGTSGHNAWQRMLLGSTANKVVSHAQCPVLVVPHDAPLVGE